MKIEKQTKTGATRLLLCLAGWSAVPQAFAHLQTAEDQDVWVCYDYRELNWDEDLSRYNRIDLIAWSLGVWVANRLLHGLTFDSATAICGTGRPYDDAYGIPCDIFRATLENVTDEGMKRFNRRMCGSRDILAVYNQLPFRPTAELKEELQAFYNYLNHNDTAHCRTLHWTKAIIGNHDMIFPAANQRAYWQNHCSVTEIDAPHYPFNTWREWREITD